MVFAQEVCNLLKRTTISLYVLFLAKSAIYISTGRYTRLVEIPDPIGIKIELFNEFLEF